MGGGGGSGEPTIIIYFVGSRFPPSNSEISIFRGGVCPLNKSLYYLGVWVKSFIALCHWLEFVRMPWKPCKLPWRRHWRSTI